MTTRERTHFSRAMAATYGGGFFSLSLLQMVALATPLWGGQIGLSLAVIGFAVGARSITPMIYSIHLGAIMDSIGVRRTMLFFAALCIVLPPLYPLLPYAAPLIVLQLVLGLASATVWLASQTAVARLSRGDSRYTARFSFIAAAGTVAGPLLLGFAWDQGGGWAGYGLISLWGVALFASSIFLPRRNVARHRRFLWRSILPDPAAYRQAWDVVRLPIGFFIMACTFLRLASVSMQDSFYPLLLQGAGYSSTAIGTLIGIGNLISSPASLASARLVRLVGSDQAALMVGLLMSILAIAVTPALNAFWAFAVAMAIYGFGLGVSMPLIFSLLGRGVPPDQLGVTAGLRATVNRFAAVILPIVMGLIAAALGLANSFWVMGVMLLLALVAISRFAKRHL